MSDNNPNNPNKPQAPSQNPTPERGTPFNNPPVRKDTPTFPIKTPPPQNPNR